MAAGGAALSGGQRQRIALARAFYGLPVVVIMDDSMPFGLGLAPERDLDLSLEDTPLGGLGLYLVHQMMDGVDYRREAGCNIVTLIKDLHSDDGQNGR